MIVGYERVWALRDRGDGKTMCLRFPEGDRAVLFASEAEAVEFVLERRVTGVVPIDVTEAVRDWVTPLCVVKGPNVTKVRGLVMPNPHTGRVPIMEWVVRSREDDDLARRAGRGRG